MTRKSKRELERDLKRLGGSEPDESFKRAMVYTQPYVDFPTDGEPVECEYLLTSEGERIPRDCEDVRVILPFVLHPAVEGEISHEEVTAYWKGEADLEDVLPREQWVVS